MLFQLERLCSKLVASRHLRVFRNVMNYTHRVGSLGPKESLSSPPRNGTHSRLLFVKKRLV